MGAWLIGTYLLLLIRGALLVFALQKGFLAAPYVVIEGTALWMAIRNIKAAEEVDTSIGGVWVPLAYALGIGCMPRGGELRMDAAMFALASMVLSVWALVSLGPSFTAGGSSWVRLVDVGPYRWLRHPQVLARLLWILAVLVGTPGAWSFAGCVVAGMLALSVMVTEERFLLGRPEYQAYAWRVRHRLIPGFF